ncbi:hypothetical protein [Staphylococcus hominis]|uniref:hypothetical protein n=1 Tax=Staphylococcus hominis TaxID=1290 RepID=UPI0011A11964|nr:hypothetical protein [Staphylococcus hominis]
MKKTIYFITTLVILTIVLSACSKDNKDLMQGTWKADTPTTKDEIGEELVIKDQDIKVNDDNGLLTETDYLKYFNFKDKDQTKIRMYNEKGNSDDYDKDLPKIEGKLSISKDKMTIKDKINGDYIFRKE